MAEEDKQKTAFVAADVLCVFNAIPFNLSNAPTTFERTMYTVLRDLRWKVCLCFLDDIVVFSSTFLEHLQRLETVCHCLMLRGVQLTKKCHFA